MALNEGEIAIVKGMLVRGDPQHDIAAYFGITPVLAFNDLSDQTSLDEQEGMMHLFEGAVLAIRNPGGHAFPEGTEQRAIEYISLLSLLAYRVQEAKKRSKS